MFYGKLLKFLAGASAALAVVSSFGGPLQLSSVARDAKWVIHLDMEAFRKTRLGAHFVDRILQRKLDGMEGLKDLKLSLNLQNIGSLTAFGPAFEKNGNGVLLIRTTADVKSDLDTLAGLASLSGGQALTLTHLKPYPLYSYKSNVFLAPDIAGAVVIAKSREQIEHARQILLGKAESLAQRHALSDYPPGTNRFFLLGMAEGLGEAQVPAQAQVLKEAQGGRLELGENGEALFARLIFKGRDDESALKIQQVFQGIAALGALARDNPEISELARGVRISSEGDRVSIRLQFPVRQAIGYLDQEVN